MTTTLADLPLDILFNIGTLHNSARDYASLCLAVPAVGRAILSPTHPHAPFLIRICPSPATSSSLATSPLTIHNRSILMLSWLPSVKVIVTPACQTTRLGGILHSFNDQPSLVIRDGRTRHWHRYGHLHRDNDRPAVIEDRLRYNSVAEPIRAWYRCGRLHRDPAVDQPAYITTGAYGGYCMWLTSGIIHRDDDKPAMIQTGMVNSREHYWYYWWTHGLQKRNLGRPIEMSGDGNVWQTNPQLAVRSILNTEVAWQQRCTSDHLKHRLDVYRLMATQCSRDDDVFE